MNFEMEQRKHHAHINLALVLQPEFVHSLGRAVGRVGLDTDGFRDGATEAPYTCKSCFGASSPSYEKCEQSGLGQRRAPHTYYSCLGASSPNCERCEQPCLGLISSIGLIMSNRQIQLLTGTCCWPSWIGCRWISRWSNGSTTHILLLLRCFEPEF